MKVAVIFNDTTLYEDNINPAPKGSDLGFEPYFAISRVDPLADFKDIVNALNKSGHEAYLLNIRDDVNLFMDDFLTNKPNVLFNLVELYKENPKLEMPFAGILELLKVPFTGAPPLALGTCQNKTLTKRLLKRAGIRTPEFRFIEKREKIYRHGLNYPLIVKPAFEDASVGIENDSIVYDQVALRKRIDHVFDFYKQPVLLEEFIDGRELNVAIMGDKNPIALPISEIDFTRMPKHLHNIVSYQAKWDPYHEAYHKTIPICPAKLPVKITREAQKIALTCFKTVGCRDYARVDMRLSKDKKLYVLEVNPNPDLTEGAGFMRSAHAAGYTYRKALKMIVDLAWARRPRNGN